MDGSQRLLAALDLYHAGYAPVIVSSGSNHEIDFNQAELQAEWLMKMGVPQSAIIVESRSRRTYESAVEIARMARERNWKRVTVVASQLDVPRIRLVFRKLGIEPSFYVALEYRPPRDFFSTAAFPFFYHATYEYLALGYYKIRGWI